VKGFGGFPSGKVRATRIPNLFFSELLPAIDHVAELKVTLYCFWRLYQKQGDVRFVQRAEIEADEVFMAGLAKRPEKASRILEDALERATARGTLLHVTVDGEENGADLYFVNSAKGRAVVEGIERGEWRPGEDPHAPFDLSIERPNIYTLYEQNVGALTPLIAEKLRDMEETYPEAWVQEAVNIAVQQNKRSLAYVGAILERWQREGKQGEKPRGDYAGEWRRFIEEEFADYL
jgi:DnaD/phage-associated family protein